MTDKLFSIIQGRQVLAAGGFWCEACLMAKPLDDRSPDPRYCHGCYEFLRDEAKLERRTKKASWVPAAGYTGEGKALPIQEKPVTKPPLEGNLPAQETAEVLLQKNKGGRPRKAEGELVSRMTEWRRGKAEQGVLL